MDDHPAMMPMKLARRCVAITSRPDEAVLDPYAGSGTTLLAAQDLGRKWVGVELNPAFVDLIERRISAGTPNMFWFGSRRPYGVTSDGDRPTA